MQIALLFDKSFSIWRETCVSHVHTVRGAWEESQWHDAISLVTPIMMSLQKWCTSWYVMSDINHRIHFIYVELQWYLSQCHLCELSCIQPAHIATRCMAGEKALFEEDNAGNCIGTFTSVVVQSSSESLTSAGKKIWRKKLHSQRIQEELSIWRKLREDWALQSLEKLWQWKRDDIRGGRVQTMTLFNKNNIRLEWFFSSAPSLLSHLHCQWMSATR